MYMIQYFRAQNALYEDFKKLTLLLWSTVCVCVCVCVCVYMHKVVHDSRLSKSCSGLVYSPHIEIVSCILLKVVSSMLQVVEMNRQ